MDGKVNRKSHMGDYDVIDGLPRYYYINFIQLNEVFGQCSLMNIIKSHMKCGTYVFDWFEATAGRIQNV